MNVWEKLAYPFPAECVHWRVGSTTQDKSRGLALAYLDARDVMDRLDQVLGPQNWSDKYEETGKGRIICTLAVAVTLDDGRAVISKCDGAGDTDVEGDKGAMSDAFKRAAVKFGVGRYLYRLGQTWVELDKGKYIKKDPALPKWALPGGPPAPSAHTDFPAELPKAQVQPSNVVEFPVPVNPNHPTEEEKSKYLEEAVEIGKMLESFANLQNKGVKKLGLEKYMNLVNLILEEGYGGASWTDEGIDLDVARAMYKDINNAVDKAGGAA